MGENGDKVSQKGYTTVKTFSFSKENQDIYNIVSEQDNQSEFVCDAIRFYMENKDRDLEKKYEDRIMELEGEVRSLKLFNDLLKEELNLGNNITNRDDEVDDVNDKKEEEKKPLTVKEMALKKKSTIDALLSDK